MVLVRENMKVEGLAHRTKLQVELGFMGEWQEKILIKKVRWFGIFFLECVEVAAVSEEIQVLDSQGQHQT